MLSQISDRLPPRHLSRSYRSVKDIGDGQNQGSGGVPSINFTMTTEKLDRGFFPIPLIPVPEVKGCRYQHPNVLIKPMRTSLGVVVPVLMQTFTIS